ncbi:hypothetical protein SLEP1_g58047 [Rubroshorea leprosula]|uniref:E3 ubiquitin-protein ligase WAV3-like C-terminal domain-containing protein n=1 Tax=Rubroshorea leprosula TaxID=152421 RepID=A0AAV5MQV7_9ROSI|nr:hypothetical protein SLEP1_g58047 [Rubroshorea leprosula]
MWHFYAEMDKPPGQIILRQCPVLPPTSTRRWIPSNPLVRRLTVHLHEWFRCQIHHRLVNQWPCLYKDPATQEVVYDRDQGVLVPPPHSGGRATSPKIEQLRYLFISTRAIAESRRLIEHNDLTSANHLLASSRALLVQSNSMLAEEYIRALEAELAELQWRRQQMVEVQRRRTNEREAMPVVMGENGEPLTPTSAWRAAEKLAKVAIMKKLMNRVSDLHGFENARF